MTQMPTPATLHIRSATPSDAQSIAEVQVASWQTTYARLLPRALIEAMTTGDRAQAWTKILTTFDEGGLGAGYLCEAAGKPVGFATMGPQRDSELEALGFSAELTSIYLLEDMQRQGIGRVMMAQLAQAAKARGHDSLAVWVIEGNQVARDFYAALGGVLVHQRFNPEEPDAVGEVAYGWRDLSALERRVTS
ncbi:Acetyltransferase (GNAT) family protein [Aquimixticola soesokkakensis]|uniref:Acetyltransferase (GNAT) family protein n=1 Tax=Aquimixticola soesokkakensis TaxID=1519096 RepID=A0A1Y5S331_9RHOB|nr:GNAT family N-acetyltransferase [Aquimixticola soesokkakensis]SLN31592.1 Acetyltransferase (GNAT) family protein [Aquimixticola soesokkakensis]